MSFFFSLFLARSLDASLSPVVFLAPTVLIFASLPTIDRSVGPFDARLAGESRVCVKRASSDGFDPSINRLNAREQTNDSN